MPIPETNERRPTLGFSHAAWVAVILLVGMAIVQQLANDSDPPTLEFVHRGDPVIVHMTDSQYEFPALASSVTLPSDWIYLSVTDPSIADRPTFINRKQNTIIRLQPESIVQEDLIQLFEQHAIRSDRPSVRWLDLPGEPSSIEFDFDGMSHSMHWFSKSPIRLGYLDQQPVGLIVLATGSVATIDDFVRGIHSSESPDQ